MSPKKNGEFRGEVLTTLKFLEQQSKDQAECLKRLEERLDTFALRYSWTKYGVGVLSAWLAGVTAWLVSRFA